MKKTLFLAFALMFFLVGPVYADNVYYLNGTTNVTTALTGYSTYGDQMAGMKVTVYFASGSETAIWAATSSGSGSAVGTTWSLAESGDTWSSEWTLANRGAAIKGFSIDAGAGSTVFDTDNGSSSTDGSASGSSFSRTSSNGFSTDATYSDIVALSGYAPVGDLFRSIYVNFTGGTLDQGSSLRFMADTDSALIKGDVKPVPVPAAVWLLGSGLFGLVGLRRKFKK